MTDEFARFHPMVNFIFYIAVLGMTMFQMQAGMIAISFLCAGVYHMYLKRGDGWKYLVMVAVVCLVSACINPLFSHRGATLLFYLFSGNPVTLESILYGVAVAGVIGAMLLWFSSFNVIMTVDKVLAAVGVAMPHVALLLSMVFRFVPKLTRQGRAVLQANRALGAPTGGLRSRIKTQAEVFSITTTWALEHSVDTADSMSARGYGTGKRTHYHNEKLERRDVAVMVYMIALLCVLCVALAQGRVTTDYYPIVRIKGNWMVYILYTLLCMTPMLINLVEELRWRRLRFKI